MKKFFIILILVLIIVFAVILLVRQTTSREEFVTIKVFFNNTELDPVFSCNKVFPVERTILKTAEIERMAITELLTGPTLPEVEKGFLTSLNSGVKLKNLAVVGGKALVDFDERLDYQIGGPCRAAAIRAQITETLKQFPSIKEVIISVNGRTQDILQP